jgi:multiple sugar transport system substrate-binding protein
VSDERAEKRDSIFEAPMRRRDFVKRAAGLTAAASGVAPLLAACGGDDEAAAPPTGTNGQNGQTATQPRQTGGDPADIAVEAAREHSGYTVHHTYEGGLQALDPKNFSGPMWEELTGIQMEVVELPYPELYSKPIAEHIARSGAFDILEVPPPNLPSFVEGGVVVQIDDMIREFGYEEAQEDVHPLYRALGTYKGNTYGIFDDGDMFCLYYRKDIFEDEELRSAHENELGRALEPPDTWDHYTETAQFLTDQLAPDVYGAGAFRAQGAPGNQFAFFQQFRANGGDFFDRESMRATINSEAGVRTVQQMQAVNRASIPGVEELDAVGQWTAWLQGRLAMIFSWPPTGRLSENYAQRDESFSFVPASQVEGNVGYAIMPGRHGQHAAGFVKCISADSENIEAAYLTMQWMTSPSISLQRVMLPYALRDPYRISHFQSEEYRNLWPNAGEYLDTLNEAANHGVIDLIMPGAADYSTALDRALASVWGGRDPQQALDEAAAEWDRITDRLGDDAQRDHYDAFLELPGSTAENTVAERGEAVEL